MFRQAARSVRRTIVRTAATATVVIGTLEITTHLPSQGRSSEFYHKACDDWVTPLMRRFLSPEAAHSAAIYLAKLGLSPQHCPSVVEQRVKVESTVFGKTFSNPIGLGAGFDKNGEVILEMLALGFGFVEIGTVTPLPQPGNPQPRMFRLPQDLGIINRYGFNSMGAEVVEQNLKQFRQTKTTIMQPSTTSSSSDESWRRMIQSIHSFLYPPTPITGLVGMNIGMNKETNSPIGDYISNITRLGPYADYLVLNISSPNTPGLRNLQQRDYLLPLLKACLHARNQLVTKVPLLIKLAPDLSDTQLREICDICVELHVDGLVVSNTTEQRPVDLVSFHRHEMGGLSGAPVRDASTACIRKLYVWTDGSIPIVGVGGVGSGQDAYEKLKAGASLVQVYSMMVYKGPGVVSRIRRELAELMLQNGQRSVEDVIGSEHEGIAWRRRQQRLAKDKEYEELIVVDQGGSDGGIDKQESMTAMDQTYGGGGVDDSQESLFAVDQADGDDNDTTKW